MREDLLGLQGSLLQSLQGGNVRNPFSAAEERLTHRIAPRSVNHKHYYNKNFSIRNKLKVTNVPLPLNYLPVFVIAPLVQEGTIKRTPPIFLRMEVLAC